VHRQQTRPALRTAQIHGCSARPAIRLGKPGHLSPRQHPLSYICAHRSLVWSRIQSLCLDPTSYINVPPLLDPTWSYELPSAQTTCQCNAVAYSLMAGCTYCQVGESGSWAIEQQWRDVCGDTFTPDGLGFAEDVEPLPAYAWRPWDGARWSPGESNLDDPRSLANPQPRRRSRPRCTLQ